MANDTVLPSSDGLGDTIRTIQRTAVTKKVPVSLIDVGGGVSGTEALIGDAGVTMPVSGTVTANLGATDNAVLDAIAASLAGTLTVGTHGVTGTFWQATQPVSIAATVAVTGPLTDAQLRATPVAVSGTVTAMTGGLTDTQLRASAVPVSGTFWQGTQPVSGTVAISGTVTVGAHAVTNAGTFAVQVDGAALTALQLIDDPIATIGGVPLNRVAIYDGAGAQITTFGGGTQYTEGDTDASITGTAVMWEDSGNTLSTVRLDNPLPTYDPLTYGVAVSIDGHLDTISDTEDVPWSVVTHRGVLGLSIRSDSPVALTTANADLLHPRSTKYGAQYVQLVSSAGAFLDVMPASQSGTWTVQPGNTANTTAWLVNDNPVTSGGLTVSSFLSTAAVQSTSIKASAGQVYSIEFFNIAATPAYVRLYNKATTDDGSGTPVWRGTIPGNTAGSGFVKTWDKGLAFGTGIAMRCTGAIADNDTTALAANVVSGNVCYK